LYITLTQKKCCLVPAIKPKGHNFPCLMATFNVNLDNYGNNKVCNIESREDQSVWERRAPLGPHHVRKLVRKGVKVVVQPSNRRAYPMQAYANAGAIIQVTPCVKGSHISFISEFQFLPRYKIFYVWFEILYPGNAVPNFSFLMCIPTYFNRYM
jgi:hypothetical protein